MTTDESLTYYSSWGGGGVAGQRVGVAGSERGAAGGGEGAAGGGEGSAVGGGSRSRGGEGRTETDGRDTCRVHLCCGGRIQCISHFLSYRVVAVTLSQ